MLKNTVKKSSFALLLFFSSCCISMPYQEQVANLQIPPNIESSVEHSLATSFFIANDWPKICWWEVFQEQELTALIEEALVNNPTLHEVANRVALAEKEAIVVRSKLFPLVTFHAENTWEHLSKNGLYRALNPKLPINVSLTDLSLNIHYEIDFWCKNAHLFSAAIGNKLAMEAEFAQAALITTTALAQIYFALKSNLQRKELLMELVKIRQETFHLQDLLQKKALSSKLTTLFVQESIWEAEEVLAQVEAEIDANYHMINILTGKSPDFPLCINSTFIDLPKSLELPCDLSIDLLARRPDLMAQIWRAKALSYEVSAAIADFYPNINLGAFFELESTSFRKLLTTSSAQYGLQPAIHLPIFTAGAIQANVDAKRALFHEAIFSYNDLLLKSAQEVTDLLALIKSIFIQKIAQEKIVTNAQALYELTELRQKKGLDNALENYDVHAALIEKKLQDITLLYNEYAVTIKLIKALGGGYHSECVPLKGLVYEQ